MDILRTKIFLKVWSYGSLSQMKIYDINNLKSKLGKGSLTWSMGS